MLSMKIREIERKHTRRLQCTHCVLYAIKRGHNKFDVYSVPNIRNTDKAPRLATVNSGSREALLEVSKYVNTRKKAA